mmetsp:Transcript_17584/g.53164  ORF Transcript_17584/g.53164 Transcript_17584/m.53164 type:complete len:240 (+) Transcript_17584:3587-4306(+)|eukprot:scaffold2796_cov31-Tisochrysis_lutea.AAC.4
MLRKSYGSHEFAQYSSVVLYKPVAAISGIALRSARTLNRCGIERSLRVHESREVPNMSPAPIITFGDEKSIAIPTVTSTATLMPAASALASALSYRFQEISSRPRAATVRTAARTSDAMPPASAYASWIRFWPFCCAQFIIAPARNISGEHDRMMRATRHSKVKQRTKPVMPIVSHSNTIIALAEMASSMSLSPSPMRVDSSCGLLVSYQPTSCRMIDLRYVVLYIRIMRSLEKSARKL